MLDLARDFCGQLTLVREAVVYKLGGRDKVFIGGFGKVVSPEGVVLFRGNWLDCNEWASAHKEDY